MDEVIARLRLDFGPNRLRAVIEALEAADRLSSADISGPSPRAAEVSADVVRNCLDRIMDFCPLVDVNTISQISAAHPPLVRSYLSRRFNTLLKRWLSEAVEFRELMSVTETVISGSTVLAFILGADWESKDLDLYVARGSPCQQVIQHLLREGYKVQSVARSLGHPYIHPEAEYQIHAVHKLTKVVGTDEEGGESAAPLQIDVIESASRDSLRPIFKFHSSAVMNWIASDSIMITHPDLTFSMKSVFHELVRQPEGKVALWTSKYGERGFQFFHGTERLGQACGGACPTIWRNTWDAGCLCIQFGEDGTVQHPSYQAWTLFREANRQQCRNPWCFRSTQRLPIREDGVADFEGHPEVGPFP